MDGSFSGAWPDLAEPLFSKFGGALSVRRDGNSVRWRFAGQSALVELLPTGTVRALFIDRPATDAVSQRPTSAAYLGRRSYPLTRAGGAHMVADVVDFFSGVREPTFTFVATYPPES